MTSILKRKFFLIPVLMAIIGLIVLLAIFVFSNDETANNATKPPISGENDKFDFVVFGDSGVGSEEQKLLADLMTKQNPQLLIHTGDVAYQSGTFEEIQKNVLDIYSELLSKTNFYPTLGNHDYRTNKGNPLIETFNLPEKERYYRFNFNDTLFISLDTNDSLDQNSDKMVNWLDTTLSTEFGKFRWVIIYFHHPPYSTGRHGSDTRVQKKLVPIFEKNKVDIVFSGHEHNYQRSCKILAGTCVMEGPLYIITGGGGAPLYPVGEPSWFTKTQYAVHHFVKGEISGCKLKLEAVDIKNRIFDSTELSKC